jgi:omega-6 fatty acid desaturase (delta-12 desaturase)
MKNTPAYWHKALALYTKPSWLKSLSQLTITLLLFAGNIITAHILYRYHWALTLPFIIMAGFLTVKLFIIQHDCGHRSYFKNTQLCDWTGRFLSLLTWTPYEFWKRDHDKHHATSGNLDKRGFGDIMTITVAEYNDKTTFGKIKYKLYRNPIVMFGFGPAWQFLIRHRLPIGLNGSHKKKIVSSIMINNVALLVFFSFLCWLTGWDAVIAIWLPTVLIAATIGVWLFYIQHNFDETYWEHTENWSFVDASLHGCSYYRLPRALHWITGNIGYHHIHHLSSKIPNYYLGKIYREVAELRDVRSIGILESLKCLKLTLWCEKRKRLISFKEAKMA